MELTYLLLTGSLSALVSTLAHTVVGSSVEAMRGVQLEDLQVSVLEVLLHLLAGVGLGLMFWLSWGLAAIVDVSWWGRGLAFGMLAWLVVALPAVASLALAARLRPRLALLHAARWATTCVIAGLACSWSWQRLA